MLSSEFSADVPDGQMCVQYRSGRERAPRVLPEPNTGHITIVIIEVVLFLMTTLNFALKFILLGSQLLQVDSISAMVVHYQPQFPQLFTHLLQQTLEGGGMKRTRGPEACCVNVLPLLF